MRTNRRSEKGISLLLSIFALVMLTAIAIGMMYMSATETSINANFKAEEGAYFAARGGIEEVRDRMLTNNPNTISAVMPNALPTPAGGVLYVLQNGVTAANITNFASNNPLVDDEFCHDFSYGGMTSYPPNVRCGNLPAGTWYTTTPSIAPYALDYKWVRVTRKANNSAPYTVDTTQALANQVCWNGTSEVVLPTGTATCSAMTPAANPVYLLTSLAVMPSGARRMVQQEVAQTPVPSLPYGLFATGTGCAALTMGGGAQTYSFNSATQNPPTNPPSNATNSGGNVGANGNINFNGSTTAVNGNTASSLPGIGNCNSGNGITGTPSQYGTATTIPTVALPPPPLPNPLPPTTNYGINSSGPLAAGSYGNVNITGGATVTLAGGTPGNPAVYTMNSLSLSGGSTLVINGPVVINFAGIGAQNVINFTGGTFSNTTFVPSNFVMNYGGTNNLSIAGGAAAYAVINAPNSNISFTGGSNFYGQALGQTISNSGGTNVYYDTSLNTQPPNYASYYQIAMRELSY